MLPGAVALGVGSVLFLGYSGIGSGIIKGIKGAATGRQVFAAGAEGAVGSFVRDTIQPRLPDSGLNFVNIALRETVVGIAQHLSTEPLAARTPTIGDALRTGMIGTGATVATSFLAQPHLVQHFSAEALASTTETALHTLGHPPGQAHSGRHESHESVQVVVKD